MAQVEIKKMKQGMSYSCKEKTIILNVFKYFRLCYPDKCVTELVRRTAKATGCSEKSIFQFRKEESSATGFKEPSKTKIRKNININSRDVKYDQNVRQAIRNIVYDLKYRNIIPSLNTILKQVNSDEQLPNFSLMTLRRLLFDMGFCYEKNGNKSILVDKQAQNKDTLPPKGQQCKKVQNVNSINNPPPPPQQPQNSINNIPMPSNLNLNESSLDVSKQIPQMPMQNPQSQAPPNIIPNHVPIMNDHNHRIPSMHMGQPEHHVMPAMHPAHNIPPMMINHRRDLMPPPPPHSMNVVWM